MAAAAPAAEATAAPTPPPQPQPPPPPSSKTKATTASAVTVFRQALTALRYAVAAAVTVVVVVTAVYAFHVLTRTDDLYIDVVSSYIFVDQSAGNAADPKVSFTLSVDNPSGRVRFYYTGIQCNLKVNDNSTDNSTATFDFPDMVVAPDSVLQIGTQAKINSGTNKLIEDLQKNRGYLSDANLTLTGNLTVGVYSKYNKTSSVPTKYYCTYVDVGNVSDPSVARTRARGRSFRMRGKLIEVQLEKPYTKGISSHGPHEEPLTLSQQLVLDPDAYL